MPEIKKYASKDSAAAFGGLVALLVILMFILRWKNRR